MSSDGPFTVWFEDALDNRTKIKSYEHLKDAENKANRIFRVQEAEQQFGTAVHIMDGRGKIISSEMVQ